jgi:hypothetical protein
MRQRRIESAPTETMTPPPARLLQPVARRQIETVAASFDTSPVIGWAGWQALGTAFRELRENEGWQADRLAPVLVGLLELLPCLLQWHNEPDLAHGGTRLGDFFAGFVDEEARSLGSHPRGPGKLEAAGGSPERAKSADRREDLE